jgi:hypothetical protein
MYAFLFLLWMLYTQIKFLVIKYSLIIILNYLFVLRYYSLFYCSEMCSHINSTVMHYTKKINCFSWFYFSFILFRFDCLTRRMIRLIDSNVKCRYLIKLTCKGTLQQVFICLKPPPILCFCLEWKSNFVGYISGQIQSVKLQHNSTSHHPLPAREGGRGGGGDLERMLEGNKNKTGTKIATWLTVSPDSPVYKLD